MYFLFTAKTSTDQNLNWKNVKATYQMFREVNDLESENDMCFSGKSFSIWNFTL